MYVCMYVRESTQIGKTERERERARARERERVSERDIGWGGGRRRGTA